MKSILICLLVAGLGTMACHQDNAPAPAVTPTKPALSETNKVSTTIGINGLKLMYRTGKNQANIESGFTFWVADSIKEVGFVLSDSDTLLSSHNPAQQRIVVPTANQVSGVFWAELPALQAGKRYYIDSYVIFPSGNVYYGRNNADRYVSKTPRIGVSSFIVPATDTTGYSSLQVVRKAALPVKTANTFASFFSLNNTLYVLSGDGTLFAYDGAADQWIPKQSVKTRFLDRDQNTHFNGTQPTVFTANGREYVYFTADANSSLISNVWYYDSALDNWTFVGERLTTSLLSYSPIYSTGSQAYLYNPFPKQIVAFNSLDNSVAPVSQVTTIYPTFIPGTGEPLVYYATGSGTSIGHFDLSTGAVVDSKPLLAGQLNTALSQNVLTSLGADVLLGAGINYTITYDKNPALTISAVNDELVRYSTTTNQITARYNLRTLNDDYWNRQVHPAIPVERGSGFYYNTLVAGSHVYVIDSYKGSLTELVF